MKDCLIIGPTTAIRYNEVYPLLVSKDLRTVNHHIAWFLDKVKRNDGIWFTTLTVIKPDVFQLTKTYNPKDYPRFDNAPDIIESKSKDIPVDYKGLIAVSISFFHYYPELDYEVIEHRGDLKLNGKTKFERLIIRRKQL